MKRKNVGFMVKAFFGSLMMLFGGYAFAVPPDFSTLTAAVDFSTTEAAVLVIMASLATLYILIRGGSLILSKIRR